VLEQASGEYYAYSKAQAVTSQDSAGTWVTHFYQPATRSAGLGLQQVINQESDDTKQ